MERERGWLLPPSLDELVPEDHPARFVAEFVDGLSRGDWEELGVAMEGEAMGAPAYHPRALLAIWLYGFMTGVRSCRKLEGACRDQVPYLWLSGWQRPDHNTLWRFYRAHRQGMRRLLGRTVGTAVRLGLVELAVQAVDGTKVGANASAHRSYSNAALERLLGRTKQAVEELERQNEAGEDAPPPKLPEGLAEREVLRERVREAMGTVSPEKHGLERYGQVNLTDGDARLMKTKDGFRPAYNAQAMVSPLLGTEGGMVVTAAGVSVSPHDGAQLVPMMDRAEETVGAGAELTLADAGYHSGSNLSELAGRGRKVAMPEPQARALEGAYHKDRFGYDSQKDHYICPQGQVLRFSRTKLTKGKPVRLYRASGAVCRNCPAFGNCTKDRRHGRALEIGPHEEALRAHRSWMATAEAKEGYRRRMQLVEPVFGIIKEQLGARRFLLRGLANVAAEWALLATAFNLRTLWKVWRTRNLGLPAAA